MHVRKIGMSALAGLLMHDYRYVGDGRKHEKVKHHELTKDNIIITNVENPGVLNFGKGINTFKRMQYMAFGRAEDAKVEHEETAGRKPKRNSVGAISTVVTLPFDWPDDKDKLEFFKAAYKALGEYYKKNGIDIKYMLPASIHYDETTPHMHTLVIPMRNGKLDGCSLVNRKFLRELHPFVQSKVEEDTKVKCSVLLDGDDKLRKAISKLDSKEEVDLVNNYITEQQKRIKKREELIKEREKKLIRREKDLNRREEELKERTEQLEADIQKFAITEGRMKALEQADFSVVSGFNSGNATRGYQSDFERF